MNDILETQTCWFSIICCVLEYEQEVVGMVLESRWCESGSVPI